MDAEVRHEVDQLAERRREGHLLRGPQVCRAACITYRQLDYWARTGTLEPIVDARGSGTQRRYTRRQARAAHVLGMLSEMGARHDAMASAAEDLQALGEDEWTGHLLVWPDGATVLTADPRDVVTPCAWMVDLAVCAATFDRRGIPQPVRAVL